MKQTKKVLSVILALVLSLSVLGMVSFAAEDSKLVFGLNEKNQAILVSCGTLAEGTVTVPAKATIDGKTYDVFAIGDEAFKGCDLVTRITISEGIAYIGVKAFAGCKGLTTVDIPASLIECDYDAFRDCGEVTVNCHKTNYQFFAVYGLGENIRINVVDSGINENGMSGINKIVQLIRKLILKILSLFNIVPRES